MTEACVFCGGTPTTNEHLFPKWTEDWLKRVRPEPSGPNVTVRLQHTRGIENDRGSGNTWNTDAVPSITVNCVCHDCNHGWMNRMETAASPLLLRMMDDEPLFLSRADERAIANWLGLKAVIMQYARGQFPGDWTQQFYADQRIPDQWKVRIGRYTGDRVFDAKLSELTITGKHWLTPFAVRRTDLFLGTLVMGHFVGQVIGSRSAVAMTRVPR